MNIVKKTLIRIIIAFSISGALEIFNKMQYLSFFDKLFIFALIFLVLGGFTFVGANGFFSFQKYAIKKVASKMPFFSKLLLNAGTAKEPYKDNTDNKADKYGSEKKKDNLENFHEFKKSETDKISQSDSYPSLLSAVIIGLFCIIMILI